MKQRQTSIAFTFLICLLITAALYAMLLWGGVGEVPVVMDASASMNP